MKIKFNRRLTDSDKELLALGKEFIMAERGNNGVCDKISLDLREYRSKKYGLSFVGDFTIKE